MTDELPAHQRETYFVLDDGRQLEAVTLTIKLTEQALVGRVTKAKPVSLSFRFPAPDAVMNTTIEQFKGENILKDNGILALIRRKLGNPEPLSPEMWPVLDWCRLLRLAGCIKPTILRSRPVNLDEDVLYTGKGAKYVRETRPDSLERQHIEASFSRTNRSRRSKFWSEPIYAIRQHFANLRKLESLTNNEDQSLQTNWGMLRAVAAMDDVMELGAVDLFAQATYHPFPIIVPFSQEDAWEWRCQELASLDYIDDHLKLLEKQVIQQHIAECQRDLSVAKLSEQGQLQTKLDRLKLYENPSETLPKEEQDLYNQAFTEAHAKIYDRIWQEAYKLNYKDYGGDTVPLAQSLEYEMLEVYHTTMGWIHNELYKNLRHQMTSAERKLFRAFYLPNPYTANRIPVLDQTVLSFIQYASEDVLGLALSVLAGVKKVGNTDLVTEFTEYWKTWLWWCNLVRSGKVDQITKILKKKPTRRHQLMGRQQIFVSMQDETVSQLVRRVATCAEGSGMFLHERLQVDELNVEELAFKQIIDKRPLILARLINQYASKSQKEVLYLKFLSEDGKEPTQQEIAQQLGVSQSAISQLIKAAISAIRRGMYQEQKAGMVDWQDIIGLRFA